MCFQVGELRDVSNKGNSAEIKLFLEVELCLVVHHLPIFFPFVIHMFHVLSVALFVMFYFCDYFVLCILAGSATFISARKGQGSNSSVFQTL